MHRFGEYSQQHVELFDNWITIGLKLFEQEIKYYGYIKLGDSFAVILFGVIYPYFFNILPKVRKKAKLRNLCN